MNTVAVKKVGTNPISLQVLQKEVPTPTKNQVLIETAYAGVNPVDLKLQRGDFGDTANAVLGKELSGRVKAVGSEVTEFSVGDIVCAYADGPDDWCVTPGAFSEFACIHKDLVVKSPKGMSLSVASCCCLTGLTAYEMCYDKGKPSTGELVLVTGATGGVGFFLYQMAKSLVGPTGRVLVTCGGDSSKHFLQDTLRIPDADIISYRGSSVQDMAAEVFHRLDGARIDVAFDTVGADMKRLCFLTAGYDARVVTIVEEPRSSWSEDAVDLWDGPKSLAFAHSVSVHFVWVGGRVILGKEGVTTPKLKRRLEEFMKLIEERTVTPPVVTIQGAMSVENTSAALAALESGSGNKGRYCIEVAGDIGENQR